MFTGVGFISTDKKGNRLVSLGEFQVQKPILYVSDEGRVSSGSRVPGIGGPLLLDVNGSERYAFMYLVDRERCNLNSSYGVGLDFSLFDFSSFFVNFSFVSVL